MALSFASGTLRTAASKHSRLTEWEICPVLVHMPSNPTTGVMWWFEIFYRSLFTNLGSRVRQASTSPSSIWRAIGTDLEERRAHRADDGLPNLEPISQLVLQHVEEKIWHMGKNLRSSPLWEPKNQAPGYFVGVSWNSRSGMSRERDEGQSIVGQRRANEGPTKGRQCTKISKPLSLRSGIA